MTLGAATATDHVRLRRFSCTGALLELHVHLFCRIHARGIATWCPDAFRVDRLCWLMRRMCQHWQAVLTFRAVCMPSMSLHMAPGLGSDHPETQCAGATA